MNCRLRARRHRLGWYSDTTDLPEFVPSEEQRRVVAHSLSARGTSTRPVVGQSLGS